VPNPQFVKITIGWPAKPNGRSATVVVSFSYWKVYWKNIKERCTMLTLSYFALFGLLLAAFVIGLIFPFVLIVYLVFNDKLR
jgi:hypothetical protein